MTTEENKLVFVIHKHHATSLHFDFRLQIGRVMPSWAIPKGPSLDPTKKRLAMATTDHSINYRNFEGVLPEGSYGAGPVMIWDEGYYYPEVEVSKGVRKRIVGVGEGNKVMKAGMKKGEIKFEMHGKKIKGSFALVKTHGFGGENAWLMIKHRDIHDTPGFEAHDEAFDYSVVSKKTLKEIENTDMGK